ncbi:MAG TPA: hypothetical protein VLA36_00790 [Longimicrobiales bacterium]|nr:hypothetical protein [Longimicrobiales bacterium]
MPTPPPAFDPACRPSARGDVDFRKVGEDWLLFDPVAQRVQVLDVTAALVWSYCSGEMDVAAMETEIRRAFGAALPKSEDTGVQQALRHFADAGLLREAP